MPKVDIPATGHIDLDQEHKDLATLTNALNGLCAVPSAIEGGCAGCESHVKAACKERLATLLCRLLSIMGDHFRYEEALMTRLDDWHAAKAHLEGHRQAHLQMSVQFRQLVANLDLDNPAESARRLKETIQLLVGEHVRNYDADFARLLSYADNAGAIIDSDVVDLLNAIRERSNNPPSM